ncbi:dihydroxyacetone kinase subunit DhaL, partial [Nocardia neocaledoniensis]|uniref:dihydroxyacetone kinase subunit DhaL n=1 Tax=Nocardia neocaledoniensis TaxID=236511 RepID=UPI002457C1C1
MTTIDANQWLRAFAALIDEHTDELTALDAAIGDADHGSNMQRGTAAVVAALDDDPRAGAGAALKQAGMTLIRSVGGASGPLYGTFFLRAATAAGEGELDGPTFAAAFRAGLDGVVARGKAEAGDKTMFDALAPAADTLDARLAAGAAQAAARDAAAAGAPPGGAAPLPPGAPQGRAADQGGRRAGP